MALVADRLFHDIAGPRYHWRRIAPEHAALIAVAVAYCLVVLVRTSQSMSLTFDEVVYASQVSADTPAARFTAPRARGMTLLVAPVVAITEWAFALRIYLTVISGALMYLAFRPWLAVFRRIGGRYRYLPAIAAGFFATLWVSVLYGSMAYPNLCLAFTLIAGVGYFCRAVGEPAPGWGALTGVVVAFAAASLIRPTDALAAAGPLLVAPLLVWAWLRLQPVIAVVLGLLIGWGAWILEAFARFGGPIERLRAGSEINRGGFVNSIPLHIDALDGPSGLCRPHEVCEGIAPATALWWFLLPVAVAVGLVAAGRTRWAAVGAVTTASAIALAIPYFFLIDYSAARFLIPTYGLLAIPAAGALIWLTGLGNRPTRTLVSTVVVCVLLLHAAVQQGVLGPIRDRQSEIADSYTVVADSLRTEHGVRAPCLVWGEGAIELAYLLKCRSVWRAGGTAPAADDQAIAAAIARGDDVVVRIRSDEDLPGSLAGWRRVELPGSGFYAGYLPPEGR